MDNTKEKIKENNHEIVSLLVLMFLPTCVYAILIIRIFAIC